MIDERTGRIEPPQSTTDPDRIRGYLSDESSAMTGRADRLYYPEHAGHVTAVLREAYRERQTVTVSAAGTSLTGSRVPLAGGWVLSIERMRHAAPPIMTDEVPPGFDTVQLRDGSIYLNVEARQALVPPGLTLAELNGALGRYGLVYPPDPTESTAMVGGTIATNASGARSFHYKPTRAWVRGLEVVLPTGEILWFKRGDRRMPGRTMEIDTGERSVSAVIPRRYPIFTSKNAAGLYLAEGMDPVDLFIGSEGILGVVTMALLDLEEMPRDLVTCVAFFDDLYRSLDFVDELRGGSPASASEPTGRPAAHRPLSLEFFDRRALAFMRESFPGVPREAAAAVLFEFEFHRRDRHNPYPAAATLIPWTALLREHRAIAEWTVTGPEVARIKEFRHALPEAVNAWVRARVGKLGTDMAVPPGHFRAILEAYDRAEDCGVRTVLFGHIGDCHLHLNFLPEDRAQLMTAKRQYLELARLAVELGGTISAEHGVGKKTIEDEQGNTVPYLEVMLGREGLEAIHAIKRAFDPLLILNPGNMVPREYC